jgi:hypothetical protein
MKRSLHTALLALAVVGWTPLAAGQPASPVDPELARVRTDFEYGNYADTLKRASERIDRGNLSEAEVVELHKYAGLSAFYLGQKSEAERHLWALLQLEPDYSLDPFVVPPQAVAYFEALRKERAPQLDAIRDERRRRAERAREAEERERARVENEQQRRQLEELARQASVTRVRSQSYVVNFLPFGFGQFQQGRTKTGVVFAVTEGAFALTSVAAFLVYNSLIVEQQVTLDDRLTPDGTYTLTVQGIPADHQHKANVWRDVKYASAGAFWVTYVVGVVDALIHHKSEIVLQTTGVEPPREGSSLPHDRQSDHPTVELAPSPAGAGASLGLRF